jgi:hypothetical protein
MATRSEIGYSDRLLAIRSDGTLAGWGYSCCGQINVPGGTFTAVAAGDGHSLAIRSDGTLAGWGWNGGGQINVPSGTFTAVARGIFSQLGDPQRRDAGRVGLERRRTDQRALRHVHRRGPRDIFTAWRSAATARWHNGASTLARPPPASSPP